MGNLIVNIRILYWHFQISNQGVFNFISNKEAHKKLDDGWFAVYDFFGINNFVYSRCVCKEKHLIDIVTGEQVYKFSLRNGRKFIATKRFSFFRAYGD